MFTVNFLNIVTENTLHILSSDKKVTSAEIPTGPYLTKHIIICKVYYIPNKYISVPKHCTETKTN